MKIKILVLNISDLGGIERAAMNLYNTFKTSPVTSDVQIISINGKSDKPYAITLKGNSENSKLLYFSKNIDKNTIVLSMYDRFSIKLSIIRKLFHLNFQLYACQHADFFAHKPHTRLLRSIFYRWVDKIIALTEEDSKLYKLKFKHTYVVPNVLSFYPQNIQLLKDRKIDCAAAGRLVPIKQFDHFIYFLQKIYKRCGNYKIYGNGIEFNTMHKLLQDSKINSEDILVGSVNDIEKEFCNVKFFFVTSERESFSMVILEAMACGCVVISYDCPTGPRELIKNNINGILVPLNDKNALVEKYNELINTPELCQTISNNARAYSKNFLSGEILKKWIFIFNEQ